MRSLIHCSKYFILSYLFLPAASLGNIYIVDNAANTDNLATYTLADGTNTLRKCIRLANANPGLDNINFNLPGAAPFIITTSSPVLAIISPVVINAYTQPGASAGNPMVQLTSASSLDLLQLNIGSDGSTISGFVLYGANCTGIKITNSGSHTIAGNYIGTNATGTAAGTSPTTMQYGIVTSGASNCTIGGNGGISTRNIISGNSQKAIYLQAASNGTIIQGNYIGTNALGTAAIPNANAVEIATSLNTLVGGASGKSTRNIISGNSQRAVYIRANSDGTTVQGNYIGVDSTGNVALGNQQGIEISTSNTQTIGGTSYKMKNIISGNTQNGIIVATCATLTIKGNFIGVGEDGKTSLGNTQNGINLQNPTSSVTIGGLNAPERNIISNNKARGIAVNNASGITIQNNYIGVDSTGLLASGNSQNSIEMSTCTNVLIGGSTYSAKNIICSSVNGSGILMSTCSTSVAVKGNFIGIAKDGQTALGNKNNGIQIQTSTPVVVGGTIPEERNIVSANLASGIQINNSGSVSVQNNYIGVDSTGLQAKGNGQIGLTISTAASLIVGGSSVNLRNIIASNRDGVNISQAPGLIFRANYVGIAANGSTSLGHTQRGVLIQTSNNALIGGALLEERNIISNNVQQALELNNCTTVTVFNNYIGVDATGLQNKGNGQNGIVASTCPNLQIGGGSSATRNICSGNGQDGILINGNCMNAIIKGNFCGIGADGLTVIPNAQSGIRFGGGTSIGAQIGGTAFMDRNVCSGNGYTVTVDSRDGIRIEGGSKNHIIKGNYCGVDSTGTIAIGNAWAGLSINEATDCIIGGTGTYEGNICSANQNEGVYFRNALRNTFIGNYVGTDKTGTVDLGNEDFGVNVRFTSLDNVIGGSTLAEKNYITNTKGIAPGSGVGVYVEALSQRNKIVRNKIYCNAGKGIYLEPSANESIVAPVTLLSATNAVNGTGSIDGDSIHVYLNVKSGGFCDCEGEIFVGATVVSGGTWSLTHNLGLSVAQTEKVTATETTANNSTSEFSDCVVPLPVELISFTASKQTNNGALISWSTASEQNNNFFEVQRSSDGIHFQTIATIAANGNSTSLKNYSIYDMSLPEGIVYYKLKQTDLDGTVAYSKIVSLSFSADKLSILQHPNGFTILIPKNRNSEQVFYEVYSLSGVLITQGNFPSLTGSYSYTIPLNLATGLYIVHASQGNDSVVQKILVTE